MHAPPGAIERYVYVERASHWLLAIFFFLAGLSGLAFFHPSMFWMTNLFGGGPWTRILHPFLGLVMAVFFIALALRVWHHNIVDASDKEWLKHAGDVMAGHEERAPPAGKYNAGQKLLFWFLALCMLGLLVTGFVFWRPYFAGAFPIWLVRLATLLHALAATGLILLVIGHIYMSLWTTGSIRAMTQGWVTRRWALLNHPRWYREVTKN
ncbi:MAG TPA: formate dehydrogenase subunit gamma [Casimicrobiaceae bacterium]|nr:formate dehydrogenase subunit gamma [Casimicrobiaceae bacterium]